MYMCWTHIVILCSSVYVGAVFCEPDASQARRVSMEGTLVNMTVCICVGQTHVSDKPQINCILTVVLAVNPIVLKFLSFG